MSLRQKVDDELKAAMKASSETGHRERLDTIRLLKSAVKYREIELGQSLDDAGVATVVGSLDQAAARFGGAVSGRGSQPRQATKEEAEGSWSCRSFLPVAALGGR